MNSTIKKIVAFFAVAIGFMSCSESFLMGYLNKTKDTRFTPKYISESAFAIVKADSYFLSSLKKKSNAE